MTAVSLLSLAGASAQPRPAFEVASIRPTDGSGDASFVMGIRLEGSNTIMRNVGLSTLVHAAFGIDARFLSSGDWLKGTEHFDVRAKIPDGASPGLVPEMIQTLLEDRFQLAYHFERQQRNVYALLLANGGPKFKKSTDIDESMPGGAVTGLSAISDGARARTWRLPNGSSMRITVLNDGARWDLKGFSMLEVAFVLNTLDGLDIVDMTGLSGRYDLSTSETNEEACELCAHPSQSPASGTPGQRESLQRLGLRLEKRKATVKVLVIDHLQKQPTEN